AHGQAGKDPILPPQSASESFPAITRPSPSAYRKSDPVTFLMKSRFLRYLLLTSAKSATNQPWLRISRFLVALGLVQDLLLCAKHLFVAASAVWRQAAVATRRARPARFRPAESLQSARAARTPTVRHTAEA